MTISALSAIDAESVLVAAAKVPVTGAAWLQSAEAALSALLPSVPVTGTCAIRAQTKP